MSETYLTTEQLSGRIHHDARTIRTRLKDAVLLEGVHYIRPFGGRKLLFIWEAIQRDIGTPSASRAPLIFPWPMAVSPVAKVRVRPETGTLYLDFFYRGVRCREQTALTDTSESRKKVQSLLNRVQKDMAQGAFEYAAVFLGSPRAAQFGVPVIGLRPTVQVADSGAVKSGTPLFTDFAELWFLEMSPQWRRLHRSCVREVLNKNLLPTFGSRPVGEVTKADVLAFRAQIAQLPGRKGTLGNARINKIMCFLRQILNEAADRFEVTPTFP